MPEAALKPQVRVGNVEVAESLVRRTQAVKATAETAPTGNAIFRIIFDEALSPEAKRASLAAYLAFPGGKEESRAHLAAYREFEEWLQAERERMSREIIKLTDTETFSELQSVYRDLNGALIEFDEKMKPLSEIIDAIYVLRTNDKTMDAFSEIQTDRVAEDAARIEREGREAEFTDIAATVGELRSSIAVLGEERSFFGLGGVKQSARQAIAQKEVELATAQDNLGRLEASLAAVTARRESSLGEFTAQKDKLRELLDISSDEHKQRQRELVSAATDFIDKAKTRIGSVRDHLGRMTGQIESLYDSNTKMSGVYAVMADGVKDAVGTDGATRTALQAAPPDEGTISRLAREEKLGAIEDHVRSLDSAAGSTIETLADLTGQTIRIRTMREANEAQIDKARRMHNQGVAGVADRLSVVLNAVSAAALGESSEMARGTLAGMIDRTNEVASKEVIQLALGVRDVNRDVEKAIADLGSFGEVLRTSTNLYREGLEDLHGNIDRMRDLAESVRGDVREASGVVADSLTGEKKPAAPEATRPANPFGRT